MAATRSRSKSPFERRNGQSFTNICRCAPQRAIRTLVCSTSNRIINDLFNRY